MAVPPFFCSPDPDFDRRFVHDSRIDALQPVVIPGDDFIMELMKRSLGDRGADDEFFWCIDSLEAANCSGKVHDDRVMVYLRSQAYRYFYFVIFGISGPFPIVFAVRIACFTGVDIPLFRNTLFFHRSGS